MLHAGNIVLQIGNARSNSRIGTVSYQTTPKLSVPNWDELPGQSNPCTGPAVQRPKILADHRTKLLEVGGTLRRMDPPDRNGSYQPAKNGKLAPSHLAVENLVRKRVGYKRKKASLWPDFLDERGLIGAAVAQEIDSAKWKRAALETRSLVSQSKPALLPSRAEVRERLR
jgi:hypothetical protein